MGHIQNRKGGNSQLKKISKVNRAPLLQKIKKELGKLIDNGTLTYYTRQSVDLVVNHTAKFFKIESLEVKEDKFWLRDFKKKKYEFINYISIYKFFKKTRINISFNYSRFKNKDNYKLLSSDKEIKEVHICIAQLLQAITGEPIILDDIELTSIDICNQIETNFEDKYQTFELLIRTLNKEQTTLYLHTNENNRKIIQGFSLFEEGRAKKEQKTYFKIYNKFKERLETGKDTEGRTQAIRAELTLRQSQLKKLKINSIHTVNKKTLDEVIKKVLGSKIKKDLETVIKKDLEKLIEVVNDKPFNRQDFLKYEYLIFDIEFLKYIFSPEISGMTKTPSFYHKKLVLEQLNDLEKKGEIVKKYSGNIKDLEKILDKLFKTKVKIKATAKGIDVTWLE